MARRGLWTAPARWQPERAARHRGRTRHLARTDPGGCWLIEDETAGPVGAVLSSRREGTWALSLLAVVPGAQGKEVGKALLAQAMVHGRACLRGIACAPGDPVAAAHPAPGRLHAAPRAPAHRSGGHAESSARWTAPCTRAPPATATSWTPSTAAPAVARTAPTMTNCCATTRLLVVDDLAGSGYCYTRGGRVESLAATSRRLATRLLTAALLTAAPGEQARVTNVLAESQWAVDVAVTAGLDIAPADLVCLRGGLRPPELALLSPTLP